MYSATIANSSQVTLIGRTVLFAGESNRSPIHVGGRMRLTVDAGQPASRHRAIDVLAFPPDARELQQWQSLEATRWHELERRGRVLVFLSIGMFLAWAADVGAAFELGDAGSAWFGIASVPLAILVVLAHVLGRWVLDRATRGHAAVRRRYADVTLGEAKPLLELAAKHAAVAQYLRCVGRQRRALRRLERSALYEWAQPAMERS
jgi:hypothetical protein